MSDLQPDPVEVVKESNAKRFLHVVSKTGDPEDWFKWVGAARIPITNQPAVLRP